MQNRPYFKRKFRNYGNDYNDNSNHQNRYQRGNLNTGNSSRNISQENRDSQETLDEDSYFSNALTTLNSGLEDEQKEAFFTNVLEKTEGQELKICSQSIGSRLVEILLETTNDLSAVVRFMHAFAKDKEDAFGNRFASHVTEQLLYLGLLNLQNWSDDISSDEDSEETSLKKKLILDILSWIQDMGEFCLGNMKTCLEDKHGSPVLRTLIQVLGGYYISHTINQSKRSKKHKTYFEHEHLGLNHTEKIKESITLTDVPKGFVTSLKHLAVAFLKLNNLINYSIKAQTVGVVQSFLLVLKHRLPKHSKTFVSALTACLFEHEDHNGIPRALLDPNSSIVVEKVFESLSESQQEEMWNTHVQKHIHHLVTHKIGNFVIQRLLDIVQNESLFEAMSGQVMVLFTEIVQAGKFGILQSMASACNRLKGQQANFMTHLLRCLKCDNPKDRELFLVPLLLGFQTHPIHTQRKTTDPNYVMAIYLQGSLLVQSILNFHKPTKAVNSILNLKAEEIKYMACHLQGCHVLTSFLQSPNVGEKNKDKFVQLLKPILPFLSKDRNGNLTLCRMWVLMSIKQKTILAQEFVAIQHQVKNDSNGNMLLKKFGIHHFKNANTKWQTFQEDLANKRKLKE